MFIKVLGVVKASIDLYEENLKKAFRVMKVQFFLIPKYAVHQYNLTKIVEAVDDFSCGRTIQAYFLSTNCNAVIEAK